MLRRSGESYLKVRTKKMNPFDCNLKGEPLSYLHIWRLEGLTEKGKDKFIEPIVIEHIDKKG